MIRLNSLAQPAARLFPLALSVFLLAGCMTPSPYAPRLEGQQTGYTDRAITQNRYRVTFTADEKTYTSDVPLEQFNGVRVGDRVPLLLRGGAVRIDTTAAN